MQYLTYVTDNCRKTAQKHNNESAGHFYFSDILKRMPEIDNMHDLKFSRKNDINEYNVSVKDEIVTLKRRYKPRAIVLKWNGKDRFFIKFLKRKKIIQLGPKQADKNIFYHTVKKNGLTMAEVDNGGNHEGYFLFVLPVNELKDKKSISAIEEGIKNLVQA